MRKIDPDLRLVVCSSSMCTMPTFPKWEDEVLTNTNEDGDYMAPVPFNLRLRPTFDLPL